MQCTFNAQPCARFMFISWKVILAVKVVQLTLLSWFFCLSLVFLHYFVYLLTWGWNVVECNTVEYCTTGNNHSFRWRIFAWNLTDFNVSTLAIVLQWQFFECNEIELEVSCPYWVYLHIIARNDATFLQPSIFVTYFPSFADKIFNISHQNQL